MSEYTMQEDEARSHVHFHPDSETGSNNHGGLGSLMSRIVGGKQRVVNFEAGFSNTQSQVIEILDIENTTIPIGFELVVDKLRGNGISFGILKKNGIVIGKPEEDRFFKLFVTYDKNTGEYIEYHDGIKLKYQSIFQVLKRIEDHDFDVGIYNNSQYIRKNLTEGIEDTQAKLSGIQTVYQGIRRLIHRNQRSPDINSTNGNIARFLVSNITVDNPDIDYASTVDHGDTVQPERIVEHEIAALSEALGNSIPHTVDGDALLINYPTGSIIVSLDDQRRYKINAYIFNNLTEVIRFIVDDYNNFMDALNKNDRNLNPLKIDESVVSGGIDSQSTSSSKIDLKSLEISSQGRSQIISQLSKLTENPGEINLRGYCISLASEYQKNNPNGYGFIKGDVEGILFGLAIIIKTLRDIINSQTEVSEIGSSDLDVFDHLSVIQLYMKVRGTMPNETFNAFRGYFNGGDILDIDTLALDKLQRGLRSLIMNDFRDSEQDVEGAQNIHIVRNDLQAIIKREEELREELLQEINRMANENLPQEEIDKGSYLMRQNPGRVVLLREKRNLKK